MTMSSEDRNRYSRHLRLPGFDDHSQSMLQNARVLVVGAGGLGCPVLQYLTAAGVGTLGIADPDVISLSNLQRQVLYTESDLNAYKATVAIRRLKSMNAGVNFREYRLRLESLNALEIISEYDIVVDGTDNLASRYLLNDACCLLNIPLVYGSVYQYEGQVSVFHLKKAGGYGPNYRDLFPAPPPPELVPDCTEGGVLGALPGIIGTMQAMETIKVLTHLGEPLSGRLALFDSCSFTWKMINIQQDPGNPLTGANPTQTTLIDYDVFCGEATRDDLEIEGMLLRNKISSGEAFFLLDVREAEERKEGHLGGVHIPLGQLPLEMDRLPPDEDIIVYCQSGKRSRKAVEMISEAKQSSRVWSLKGGWLEFKNSEV